MGRNRTTHLTSSPRRCLIAGNYCHDVLIRDGVVLAETLGGAASFISNVFDGVSVTYNLVSKVGPDFAYSVHRDPIVVPDSRTTLFHAHFESGIHGEGQQDRVLKRVDACDPIRPSDLPDSRFDFGMVVGVGGEITVETVEKLVEICGTVFVDIQALIRVFDEVDGSVRLVGLKESGFCHLLPRIGFIKASAEEALYMDVEEVRKVCCVVVTNGKRGCRVCWRDGEVEVGPFPTTQVDPTGAGDSFLGGFVAGLNGLAVPDAALLGNLFGSLTVGQIGLPKFDLRMLQRVQEEVQKRKKQTRRRRQKTSPADPTPAAAPKDDAEEKAVAALREAFSSVSVDDAVSALREANGDPDKAAEILVESLADASVEPFTSSTSGVSGFDTGYDDPFTSSSSSSGVSGSDTGSTSGSGSSEGFESGCVQNLVSERCRNKQKRVIASAGMVSNVLGKEYVRSRMTKPSGSKTGDAVEEEEAEQFLCSMLGDDSELNMAVIRDTPEYEPKAMNWKNVVSKLQSLGPEFDGCTSSSSVAKQDTLAKGDEYHEFRGTARQHWDTMKSYYQKAATAYSNGSREHAGYLSEQGRVQTKMAQKADEKASQEIFKARNKDIENVITIDLHGQHVKQAMKLLKIHLLFGTYAQSVQFLRVITGCGSHGLGKSKLKQSVIQLVENEGITWSEENRGVVLIKLGSHTEFNFMDSKSDDE
ncbi:hypothetical protein ACLB2K_030112 [Fragaria x ananassa]